MAKIFVYGDIQAARLYVSVDDSKEMTFSGNSPQYLTLEPGTHRVSATTVSKAGRMVAMPSAGTPLWENGMLISADRTNLSGEVELAEDGILLFCVKKTAAKAEITHELTSEAEVSRYLDPAQALAYGERRRGGAKPGGAGGAVGAASNAEVKGTPSTEAGRAGSAFSKGTGGNKPGNMKWVAVPLAVVLAVGIFFLGGYVFSGRSTASVPSSVPTPMPMPTFPPLPEPTVQVEVNEGETMPEEPAAVEYLLPTDTQYISDADLYPFTREEIVLVRNEIYARHGYNFQDAAIRAYFEGQSWYAPIPGVDASNFTTAVFNQYETSNLETIVAYEAAMGWRP